MGERSLRFQEAVETHKLIIIITNLYTLKPVLDVCSAVCVFNNEQLMYLSLSCQCI